MKRFKILSQVKSCTLCHGMGVVEKGNGDTIECIKCKGKGVV